MKIAAMLRLVKLTETYSGETTKLGRRCKQKKDQVQTDNQDLESRITLIEDDDKNYLESRTIPIEDKNQNAPVLSEKTFKVFRTSKIPSKH